MIDFGQSHTAPTEEEQSRSVSINHRDKGETRQKKRADGGDASANARAKAESSRSRVGRGGGEGREEVKEAGLGQTGAAWSLIGGAAAGVGGAAGWSRRRREGAGLVGRMSAHQSSVHTTAQTETIHVT